ncbi:G patch domain-containing protein TGH [Dendrobium catenatum]|uniref:G patch domain-containing protein TGH n=1 Tax=Dendrobium catenatum TaxID=906689 RepID=UPI0009F642EA|nr:G patch domain-containing protein TGH [Dendrobium catenatum]
MASDDEDFVFYGTPISREEDTSARKRRAIAGAGNLRSLPAWKQEVTDEEGRRRFHGAFKGGFSAGYYNTVGSKEGWSPQTFTSSRKNRAEVNKQSIYNFLDDEDIKDMGGQALETSLKFDTFGFTATELAHKQAEREQKNRPSTIPGPVPDEIVVPASSSVGTKLLLKMGWRWGYSIKDTQASSLHDARREARKALLAFSGNVGGNNLSHAEFSQHDTGDSTIMDNDVLFSSHSTHAYVLNPKQDLYGLGYDPFKHAPEFKERKMLHESRNNQVVKTGVSMKGNHLGPNSGKYAPGFGIGALEDLDVEDEDIYASGLELFVSEVEEDQFSSIIVDDKLKLENSKNCLPGFKVASSSDYSLKRFHPPVIPPDFKPYHNFASPLETMEKFLDPPPAEVPPPEDDNARLLIDGFANLVARCGKLFEDLSKEKNRSNPLFSFLSGGIGCDYYARKLWEAKHRRSDPEKQAGVESVVSNHKMTADTRGNVLGERPLKRSSDETSKSAIQTKVVHFHSNLSDTFTQSAALVGSSECAKPFKEDPAKQDRFELFLKVKYQGGLRSTSYGGTDKMSEAERARERLDFEDAADALTKAKRNTEDRLQTNQQSIEFSRTGDERFVLPVGLTHRCSQDEEKLIENILPKREEFQWRPSPLLCKRFDIVDPFMGKPPPAPRPRSKMDALVFMTDSFMDAKNEGISTANRNSSFAAANKDSLPAAQLEVQEEQVLTAEQPDTDLSSSVQRPVDLYKAIFSDDSDDEDDVSFNSVVEPEKRSDGANTTLNRIIAGDFLESLGKELGLEVPMGPSHLDKANSTSLVSPSNSKPSPALETSNALINDKEVRIHESRIPETTGISANPSKSYKSNETESVYIEEGRPWPNDYGSLRDTKIISSRTGADGSFSYHEENKADKKDQNRKHRSGSRRQLSSSDSDSSEGRRYQDRSRSGKKASLKRKHSRHEKYHKHKSSRTRLRCSDDESDSELSEDGGRDRKSRDRRRHAGRSKSDGKKYR